MLFQSIALAEEAPAIRYIAPKLSSDAEEYDPTKPEELKANQLYAKSAILIEAETGQVIFEKNADDVMFPASTTKIMTVLLGIENGNLDQTVYLSETAGNIDEGSSKIPLQVGESINFKDLLYATMLRSGNEGANAIAEAVSGDISSFVDGMNRAAQNMGLSNTNFMNPHGLHDPNHYTTARDLAKIAQHAMNNSVFRQIVSASKYTLPKSNLNRSRNLASRISEFIVSSENNSFYYAMGNGIKTGFTNAAGHCFVGSAEAMGVKLISVVLYSSESGRWTDTKKLMEYGFSQVMSLSPIELYNIDPIVLETSGYSTQDENLGRLKLDLVPQSGSTGMSLITSEANINEFSRNMLNSSLIQYTRDFRAPINKGEVLGSLTYISPQNNQSTTYSLVASRDILAREAAPLSLSQIEKNVYDDSNFFPGISLELVFYWLIPPVVLYFVTGLIARLFKKRRRIKIGKKVQIKRRRY